LPRNYGARNIKERKLREYALLHRTPTRIPSARASGFPAPGMARVGAVVADRRARSRVVPRRSLTVVPALPRRFLTVVPALPRRFLTVVPALPRRFLIVGPALPRRSLTVVPSLPARFRLPDCLEARSAS
jgi:hypothetical protein